MHKPCHQTGDPFGVFSSRAGSCARLSPYSYFLQLLLMAAPPSPAADRVYRNGVIFTADAKNGTAEALAIRDGQIVYVGSSRDWRHSSARPPCQWT